MYIRLLCNCLFCIVLLQSHAQKLIEGKILFADSVETNASMVYDTRTIFKQINTYDGGIEKQYLPDEIKGFSLNKRNFVSVVFANENQKSKSFFAEVLISGKAELYYYPGFELAGREIYLFRKKGEKGYWAVETAFYNMQTVQVAFPQSIGSLGGGTLFLSNITFNDEKPFLKYFENYFKDCGLIKNKIKNEYYSASSLELIFKDYNTCQ